MEQVERASDQKDRPLQLAHLVRLPRKGMYDPPGLEVTLSDISDKAHAEPAEITTQLGSESSETASSGNSPLAKSQLEDATENDGPEEADDEPPVVVELAPPDPHIASLVMTAMARVKAVTTVELDFGIETLPLVDHYLVTKRAELAKRGHNSVILREESAPSRQESLLEIAGPIGAYLGEVARRLLQMRWFSPPGEPQRTRLEHPRILLSANPIGWAVEALTLSDAAGFGTEIRMHPDDEPIAKRVLANLPEVRLADYYAPSNRIEVLQIVADTLVAHAQQKGELRELTANDYGPFRAEAIEDALGEEEGLNPIGDA